MYDLHPEDQEVALICAFLEMIDDTESVLSFEGEFDGTPRTEMPEDERVALAREAARAANA